MKLTKLALVAGLYAAQAAAVSAAPTVKTGDLRLNAPTTVQSVDMRKKRTHYKSMHNKPMHKMHRDDDHRYDQYKGWHRYGSRPRGWRDRHCVSVGPIWFCP